MTDTVTLTSTLSDGHRSIQALLAIRLLLIANGSTVAAVGVLYLAFGARPEGLVVGAVLVSVAVLLFGCLAFVDRPGRDGER
jgi:hypothetical protein